MRRFGFIALAALAHCASHGGAASTAPAASASVAPVASAVVPAKRAPFVLALVIDQFAAWTFAERVPELPKSGGFQRLVREGTTARDMRFAHAVTETSPGHVALFAGASPYRSGVYANELIDPHTQKRHSALRDPALQEIGAGGVMRGAGIGLGTLRIETIADVLRAHAPNATIISLSLKDRGSVFAGGRHPNASIWYDAHADTFVTSSAFASRFPEWARFIDEGEIDKLRRDDWTLLDPMFVASHAKQPDAQPGESELFGFGQTFPHSFAACRIPPLAFRASPRGDDALFELAAAALDQRNPSEPMLLTLSLSSYDYVNHFYGPDSWESWDELLRLDRSLANFFALLDRKLGAEAWSVVFSADHGGPPLPEAPDAARPWCQNGGEASDFWQRPCRHTGRIFPDALQATLQEAAVKALGKGEWVLGVASPYVFYTHFAAELPPDRRKKLDDAVTKSLLAQPEVDRVYPAPTAPCPPETDESLDALACRSLVPENKDALFFVTKRGSFVDTDYDLGKGMSHGGPYLFDRSVPLVVRAPGRVRGGVTISEPIGFGAYVRSVAALLGVPAPKDASDAKEIVPPLVR